MVDDNPPVPPDGILPGNPSPHPPAPSDHVFAHPHPLPPSVAIPPPNKPDIRKGPGPGDMKDGTREVIETIVFVVVLVLLLKTFLAEAFVIPTGSMATTLLGYHWDVTCEKCGYQFLVNGSSEGEGDPDKGVTKVGQCYCPNCRYLNTLRRPEPPKGDPQ
jgi:hypothetical protein